MYFLTEKKRMIAMYLGQKHRKNVINTVIAVRQKTTRKQSIAKVQ